MSDSEDVEIMSVQLGSGIEVFAFPEQDGMKYIRVVSNAVEPKSSDAVSAPSESALLALEDSSCEL